MPKSTHTFSRRLWLTTSLTILGMGYSLIGQAQTVVTEDSSEPIQTSTAANGNPDDVTIAAEAVVTTTEEGTVVTVDSDNDLFVQGDIDVSDIDNVVGIELQGGNSGNLVTVGNIFIQEDFTDEDTDNDGILDGPFAAGSNRTGILISGASPFVGNIDIQETSVVNIQGNDSFGIRLAETSSLVGNIDLGGALFVTGDNSVGISLENQVIGDLALSGTVITTGENSSAVNIAGELDGQFRNDGILTSTAFRINDRSIALIRELLQDDILRLSGPTVQVTADITNGIFLAQEFISSTTTDEDGNEVVTETPSTLSQIQSFGGAPAILIDGEGTPLSIGLVASITDPADEDFDEDQQYAFVNLGTVNSNGILDDLDATAVEIRDAVLENGLRNIGTLSATSFRSGDDGTADSAGATGQARVLVLGDGAIVDEINNSGIILASVSEAADIIFADMMNIQGVRQISAIGIDIAQSAQVSSLLNSGSISIFATGREGEVVAIRDASGTLTLIENSGVISTAGIPSDPNGGTLTDFDLIAIDVRENQSGVTINQFAQTTIDEEGNVIQTNIPFISGDILLGSGDDTVNIQDGTISGDIAFGDGADSLVVTSNSTYLGSLTDSDGQLSISVTDNSTLTQTNDAPINITEATFDETSTFVIGLDGENNTSGALIASGDITFEDGATIAPFISSITNEETQSFVVAQADNLILGASVEELSDFTSPFLFDSTFALDPNDPNTLLLTLDLRETSELGLDSVQSAVFPSAFEALAANAALGSAVVNITDELSFNQAINQLLPEFAAATRQFIVANVDGSTGAVATHLDNLRRSQDKPGGAWIQEYAYFADRSLEGLSEQFRGFGFGFTGGFDAEWGPFHAVGVNFGFSNTEIEDVVGQDDPLEVISLQLGTYAGYQNGNLGVEFYAGGGYNDFESNRFVEIGTFNGQATAEWDGFHYNGSIRAGYDFNIGDRFWARPTVSLDYIRLEEDGYEELGPTGIALSIDERSSETGSASAILNLGANLGDNRKWVRPGLRVGIRNDFINNGVVTNGSFLNLDTPFSLQGEEFPDTGILLGLTFATGSSFASFALDLDSDIRDGFVRHTGRIVLRIIF